MKRHLSVLSIIRYGVSLIVLLFGSLPSTALAVDIDFFQGNDILFYDPSGGGCTTVGASHSSNMDTPSLTGNDNAEKIWNFLKSEGFTDKQAAGIMGNIKQESGYDPNLTEGNGVGYGIIQWSYGRRSDLEAAANAKGVPVSDLGFQLAFLKQEASEPGIIMLHEDGYTVTVVSTTDNVWSALKNQTAATIETATKYFHDTFERSGDYTNAGGIQNRINYAKEAYEKFTGKSAGSSSSGGSNCRNQSAVGSGDLIATLLEYAWPEYHQAPYLEMKPAYAEAVKKAQADGRGVGGILYPGIDCAGFMSLLIVDSGFDPEYNSKGTYTLVPSTSTSGAVDIGGTPSTGEAIQRRWMQENWEKLGNGGSINVADLRPGDVGVSFPNNPGGFFHIFMYVGQIDGFEGQYASASLDERTPMSGAQLENATNGSFEWYGKR